MKEEKEGREGGQREGKLGIKKRGKRMRKGEKKKREAVQ